MKILSITEDFKCGAKSIISLISIYFLTKEIWLGKSIKYNFRSRCKSTDAPRQTMFTDWRCHCPSQTPTWIAFILKIEIWVPVAVIPVLHTLEKIDTGSTPFRKHWDCALKKQCPENFSHLLVKRPAAKNAGKTYKNGIRMQSTFKPPIFWISQLVFKTI